MDRKSKLISQISAASSDGDLLLDFIELYELNNLHTASVEQLEQYVADVLVLGCRKWTFSRWRMNHWLMNW